MVRRRNYGLLFIMLGVAAISAGMGLRDILEYSPTYGWISGFIFFVLGAFLMGKRK